MSNASPPPVIRRTGPFERLVALSGALSFALAFIGTGIYDLGAKGLNPEHLRK